MPQKSEIIRKIFQENKILIITGLHGVGKGTTIEKLLEEKYKDLKLELCHKVTNKINGSDKKGILKTSNEQFNQEKENNIIFF
ncbi:hypothetical protein [Spiroplasma endosymbiont of Nebria brevicollis]|uniref:hypothetical protein n=1 Tax=Spiroplasma endosymbiont of Nebria brevicollis TaxID=3066284 RepID=UPI00313AADAA